MNNLEVVNKICPASIHRNLDGVSWWYVTKLKKQQSPLKEKDKERLRFIVHLHKQGVESDEISLELFIRS